MKNKDIIIDYSNIMQKFMDNKDNRRRYSRFYITNEKRFQDGGDYKDDPIIFKRTTKYKDRHGKNIHEWDYIFVKGKECLITLNGGLWEHTDSEGKSGSLSSKKSKDLKIVGQKEFNGKIIIKGINRIGKKITNMDLWASAIIDEYRDIKNGSK